MTIPALLEGTPHLPLREGMVTDDAIELANLFYQTSLSVEDFRKTQAFLNSNQQLSLELIDDATGQVLVTFVNQAPTEKPGNDDETGGPARTPNNWVLNNPIFEPKDYHTWMADPVQVHSDEELLFLDEMGVGSTASTTSTDNNLAFRLSRLLNSYQFLGRWTSGTIGYQVTGGFKLVFKGHTLDAPDGFLIDFSPMVVIIEILHGQQKGYICLRT